MSIPVLERGGKRANPLIAGEFDSDWLVKIEKCAKFGTDPCRDEYAGITTSGDLTAITVEGVVTAFSPVVDATDAAAVKAAIEGVIGLNEFNVWVDVDYSGGDLTIKHDGKCRLESVALSDVNGGATVATTLLCTVVSVLTFGIGKEGQIGPVWFGIVSAILANEAYDYVGVTVTDDATAAQLQTDLIAALSTLGVVVYGTAPTTVVRDDVNQNFKIRIVAEYDEKSIRLDNDVIPVISTRSEFKA